MAGSRLFSEDLTISKLLYCGLVYSEKARIRTEDRPSWGLAYYESGESLYEFDDGARLSVREGEMIYLPRGSWYRVREVRRGICYAFNFNTPDEMPAVPEVLPIRDRSGMLALFRRMEASWRTKKPGFFFHCRALAYEIMRKLVQERDLGYGDPEKRLRIRPGVEAIHEGYTRDLSIASLASLCGITPEYFRVLFRREFGVSPLKYINNLRLTRAEELLQTGLYTVTQAATLSGFGDLSRFSREFKKFSGVSPAAYLRDRQNGRIAPDAGKREPKR